MSVGETFSLCSAVVPASTFSVETCKEGWGRPGKICCGRRGESPVELTAEVSIVMAGARSLRRGVEERLESSPSPLGFDIVVMDVTRFMSLAEGE